MILTKETKNVSFLIKSLDDYYVNSYKKENMVRELRNYIFGTNCKFYMALHVVEQWLKS